MGQASPFPRPKAFALLHRRTHLFEVPLYCLLSEVFLLELRSAKKSGSGVQGKVSDKGEHHLFSLVIHVSPHSTMVLEKMCRFCDSCDLLIVHQDQLEQQLTTQFLTINPEAIGNDYHVAGTLERAEWSQGKQDSSSFERLREYPHDFKEGITFRRVPVEEECL
jgi:hypothetical protein